MTQKISPEAALRVLEVFTNRVGVKVEQEERFETVNDMVMAVNMAFIQLIDASESAPQLIADKLVDLSAVCVIAVASMVAGAEVSVNTTKMTTMLQVEDSDNTIVGIDGPEEKLTTSEQRAFDIMQERMAKLRKQAGGLLS